MICGLRHLFVIQMFTFERSACTYNFVVIRFIVKKLFDKFNKTISTTLLKGASLSYHSQTYALKNRKFHQLVNESMKLTNLLLKNVLNTFQHFHHTMLSYLRDTVVFMAVALTVDLTGFSPTAHTSMFRIVKFLLTPS